MIGRGSGDKGRDKGIYSNLSNNRLGENGFGSVVMWGFCD